MKSLILKCCGFICLIFTKCVAFSTDTFLSFQEMKQLVLQEIHFSNPPSNSPFVLNTSYAPGRDALYQGGCAIRYYFSPHVCVKTGPSYSRDIGIANKWKWAFQLNYEIAFN